MHLVFLEVDTDHCHLDFKLLDENNNVIIAMTFFLQLLNKGHEQYDNKKQNISRFKLCGSRGASNISLKKLTEIEAYFLHEIHVRE